MCLTILWNWRLKTYVLAKKRLSTFNAYISKRTWKISIQPTRGSPKGTKIYVNDSPCPYYRWLSNEYKKLWNNKKIYLYFTISGTIRIKQVENGPYKSMRAISGGANSHVLSCSCIYKLLCLSLNLVHLVFFFKY